MTDLCGLSAPLSDGAASAYVHTVVVKSKGNVGESTLPGPRTPRSVPKGCRDWHVILGLLSLASGGLAPRGLESVKSTTARPAQYLFDLLTFYLRGKATCSRPHGHGSHLAGIVISRFHFSIAVPVPFLPRHTAASLSAGAPVVVSWDWGLSLQVPSGAIGG